MDREAIVAVIGLEAAALGRAGVKSLALVGSSARGSCGEGICRAMRYACLIDVSRRDTPNPPMRERIVRDVVRIF